MHKSSYKEEFEGDTSPRTAAYTSVREDSSTKLTYKLPLEVTYAGSLFYIKVKILIFIRLIFKCIMPPLNLTCFKIMFLHLRT
nr:palindromic element RPE1 domain-containing protein [Rickettsia asembonensis]